MQKAQRLSLTALEYYLPERCVTDNDLQAEFPERDVVRLANKVGIHERRYAAATEFASDLAFVACEKLKNVCKDEFYEVDHLIVCSQTPDTIIPSVASGLHAKLGLSLSCGTLDVTMGCSGFVHCLGLASSLITSEQARCVLLCTADVYSKYLRHDDLSSRILFGDGAAACLIRPSLNDQSSIGPFLYGADGRGASHLVVNRSGTKGFVNARYSSLSDEGLLKMDGFQMYTFAIREVPNAIIRLLGVAGFTVADVDIIIPHQANLAMILDIARKLEVEESRMFVFMDKTGNTVSSSIPIALKHAKDEGFCKPGTRTILVGFGVGLSWAVTLIQW